MTPTRHCVTCYSNKKSFNTFYFLLSFSRPVFPFVQDKHHASNAAPVNSTMLPVRFVVQSVQIRRTLMEKAETAVASIAPLDGHLKTAVPNALLAVRARLVWDVKIAQWGLQEKETTMRPNANDATQV